MLAAQLVSVSCTLRHSDPYSLCGLSRNFAVVARQYGLCPVEQVVPVDWRPVYVQGTHVSPPLQLRSVSSRVSDQNGFRHEFEELLLGLGNGGVVLPLLRVHTEELVSRKAGPLEIRCQLEGRRIHEESRHGTLEFQREALFQCGYLIAEVVLEA